MLIKAIDDASLPAPTLLSHPGERLSEDERTRVTRLPLSDLGRSVICKEALGDAAEARNEAAILCRLAGVAGVPAVIPHLLSGTHSLILDDQHAATFTAALPAGRDPLHFPLVPETK